MYNNVLYISAVLFVAVEETVSNLSEHLFGGFGPPDGVEVGVGFVVQKCNFFFDVFLDIKVVVDGEDLVDFVGRVVGGGGEEFRQPLPLSAVAFLEGVEEEERLFVVFDVGAGLFAKRGGVAVGVEEVVAELEGETDADAEAVQIFDVVAVGLSDEGADFEGAGEEDGGFEADHLHVFVDGDVVAGLEVHVVLLTFADFPAGLFKGVEYFVEIGVGLLDEVAPGEDIHSVARQDGGVFVPFAVDGGLAATDGRLVHEVVVEQGEVVEHLDADGVVVSLFDVGIEEVGGGEEEKGAYPFAAQGKGVGYGIVELARFVDEILVGEELFDYLLQFIC